MNIFENFHPVITAWFESTYGEPSPPQTLGWPAISAGKNALILAPTGSGKTLAAFLWSINDLFKQSLAEEQDRFLRNPAGVHTLYISPLKALNNDIERNLNRPLGAIRALSREAGIQAPHIRVLVRTGDTPQTVRNKIISSPPHILITTPESLYLLLTSTRGRLIFANLKYMIIDEIHALCSNKRGVHLNLSMERVSALSRRDPVRIGLSATQRPLDRIARYLGGWQFDAGRQVYTERPVEILDCGRKKQLDLSVISPVPRFNDMGDASVWPAVIKHLYDLITSHRTTLIFANMRAQTERLARQLNDLHREKSGADDALLVLPHHGSMSREKRFEVEEQLKTGVIPAVVATASLELGIDIGSIDLVVQLESPKSIANGIQRVGRSGHLISLTSKGRVIPLFPADLDDAAAVVHGMLEGEIEETDIPENCLDILAQQIVAEVAMQNLPAGDLYSSYRQSYCYHHLSRPVFDQVLEMLTGRYADTRLPALQPAISWNRADDMLTARRGARLQAVLNGGTIPDRGYYTVVLADERTRLGEMEEEFVFESKIGDVFYLGSSEWRIDDIRQDRIVVSPNRSVQPREPFWKGEIPHRGCQTSLRIGRFRSWLIDHIDEPDIAEQLMRGYALDRETAENLILFFRRQQEHTEEVPTDRMIVGEWFYDTAGELNFILHAPFGGRVLGLWAMAMAAYLETQYGSQIQYTYNDDALMVRIRETAGLPPIADLLQLRAEQIEVLIHEKLRAAPVFSVVFRHNAGRALLLARSRPGQRIPLWVQRLRSADLLQAVRNHPDFPILLETYRSCLQDVFDLNALRGVLQDLDSGKTRVHVLQTPYPSPMASGLLFNFVTSQMYEQDRTREPGQIASVSSDLLAQIMDREEIPAVITPAVIREAMQKWQYLTPAMRPRDAEELFSMIESIGPLSREQILERTGSGMSGDLDHLIGSGRIIETQPGWVAGTRIHLHREPMDETKYIKRVQYHLEHRGPERSSDIAGALGLDHADVLRLLEQLHKQRRIVHGRLVDGSEDDHYCDRDNFARLYRRAISVRRSQTVAVGHGTYLKFLLNWHRTRNLSEIIEKYRGLRCPFLFFEREIMGTRMADAWGAGIPELRQLVMEGKVVFFFDPDREAKEPAIKFILRGEGWPANYSGFAAGAHGAPVLDFLKENGASFLDDLLEGLQLPRDVLLRELEALTRAGLVSSENLDILTSFGTRSETRTSLRGSARKRAVDAVRFRSGRWFRLDTFGILGHRPSRAEAAAWQARLLLNRYGIVVKEFYRLEHGLLPWYEIFQALKMMEWQGEIRRGYFVKDLSGIQFALPRAVEMLGNPGRAAVAGPDFRILSTLDPALPFGRNLTWPVDISQKILRLQGNHLGLINGKPVLYCENYFSRWFTAERLSGEAFERFAGMIRGWLKMPEPYRPRRNIRVAAIDGTPAAGSPAAGSFIRAGFEKDGTQLVLWPSAL